nr:unnamed protein product [Digitaria exilis]
MRAPESMPTACPLAPAPSTGEPAAVEAVCVPWPSVSSGDLDSFFSSMGWPRAASFGRDASTGEGRGRRAEPGGRRERGPTDGIEPGVEHADDGRRRAAPRGGRKETGGLGEVEERWGVGGVELPRAVRVDGQDALTGGGVLRLLRREARRDARGRVRVGVEHARPGRTQPAREEAG